MTELETPAVSKPSRKSKPGGTVEISPAFLVENPHNYRRTTDETADAELADSIREKGVLQSLLVRPIPNQQEHYEVVLGNRRLRAARVAGVTSVPCLIRELTDAEALTVALIENVQRLDVHPIEEADGFLELHEKHGFTVAELATKTGRSEAWVRGRLKLATLHPTGRKACVNGKLSASVALLIARTVAPELQPEAIKEMLRAGEWTNEGVTLGRAREIVVRNFSTELKSVPWKLDDEELVPEAGPCASCPKRSKNDQLLFVDLERADVCLDGKCFKAKMDAHWGRLAAKANEAGQRVLSPAESKKILGKGYVDSKQFVAADGTVDYNSPKPLKWAQVAKKAGASTVLAQKADGSPVELVELTPEVRKAAKPKRKTEDRGNSEAAKRDRAAKLHASALRIATVAIVEQVEEAVGLSGLLDDPRRAVLMVVVDSFWSEIHSKVEARRDLGRGGLGKWCETATPGEIEAAIAELALLRCGADATGGALNQFLAAFGMNLRDLKKQAAANEKELARLAAIEKHQAAQSKAAKRKGARRG
jgi:ParB/RepB/Spo0J family partition protein